MTFKIRPTSNGPVIILDEEIIVLSDHEAMIDLRENYPSIFEDIQKHLEEELLLEVKAHIDASNANLNPPPTKIYSYIASLQSLWMIKNHNWPAYLDAIEQAQMEYEENNEQ